MYIQCISPRQGERTNIGPASEANPPSPAYLLVNPLIKALLKELLNPLPTAFANTAVNARSFRLACQLKGLCLEPAAGLAASQKIDQRPQ